MKEYNKDMKLINYIIEPTSEKDVNSSIYKVMMDDFGSYLKVDDGYKMKVLDQFASESYVQENLPDWMEYKSLDIQPFYVRNNSNVMVDFSTGPNSIPAKEKSFDVIFTIGSKFGYGMNYPSLGEAERVIRPGGIIVVSLSKYWFYREFSQLILSYRWRYFRAIEINYKIIESKIESAKYFCFYKFEG